MIGTWTDMIGCGSNFNIASLFHALPQDFNKNIDKFFSNYIYGTYFKRDITYLISVGGVDSKWDEFYEINVMLFYNSLKFRGLSGVDFYINDNDVSIFRLYKIIEKLKEIDNNIIIQITVQPDVLVTLDFNLDLVDIITILLFGNSMYIGKNETGKNWIEWSEYFLEKYKNKLFLGITINVLPIYDEVGAQLVAKAMMLIANNNGGGIYIWKAPDKVIRKCLDIIIDYNKNVNNYFNTDKIRQNDFCVYETGAFLPVEPYPCLDEDYAGEPMVDKFCRTKYYGNSYLGSTKKYCDVCAKDDYRCQKQGMCHHLDGDLYSPIATSVETFTTEDKNFGRQIIVLIIVYVVLKKLIFK